MGVGFGFFLSALFYTQIQRNFSHFSSLRFDFCSREQARSSRFLPLRRILQRAPGSPLAIDNSSSTPGLVGRFQISEIGGEITWLTYEREVTQSATKSTELMTAAIFTKALGFFTRPAFYTYCPDFAGGPCRARYLTQGPVFRGHLVHRPSSRPVLAASISSRCWIERGVDGRLRGAMHSATSSVWRTITATLMRTCGFFMGASDVRDFHMAIVPRF